MYPWGYMNPRLGTPDLELTTATRLPTAGLLNFFGVAGHFHMRTFIAGHKRFCDVTISYCDVTNPLILISFMR